MNGELITTTTASLYQDWRLDCINIIGSHKLSVCGGTRTPERFTVFLSELSSSHFIYLLEGELTDFAPKFWGGSNLCALST